MYSIKTLNCIQKGETRCETVKGKEGLGGDRHYRAETGRIAVQRNTKE